jgi:calcineurin-like phosphoesterase family protein
MKTWFISDLHLGHENIIKICGRPFSTVEEMNETLIKNWNKVVKNDDKVFFLGDFAFGDKHFIAESVKKLNGQKSIILGNHDRKQPRFYEDWGFVFASRFPIIYDQFVICSHKPVFLEVNSPYVNIYGHLHQHNYGDKEHYFNCSVEQIGYTPIDYEDIKKYFKGK